MPSSLHRVPAGTGLAVGPGHRRKLSTCWIDKVTCLAAFSWMQIIDMEITKGIVTIVPGQTTDIGQGFYLKAVGIRLIVVLEPPRRTFLTRLRKPVGLPRSALERRSSMTRVTTSYTRYTLASWEQGRPAMAKPKDGPGVK